MGNEVGKGTPGARIIAEEERLYGQVQARVALGDEDDGRPQVGAGDLDADLVSLRDQIAEARPEDLPPLVEQMTRLAALRARLGGGRQLPVDITSPYFAHIRLREHGKRKDVLVGKRGFIDRQSNVQIVDWRNAPVSRIYYRYEEGDDYEEEIAGRRVEGMVEVRRNISIARGALRRIGAPQGTYLKDARGGWVQAVGQLAPVLHGGMGKAARPAAVAGAKGTLGIHHGAARADKALPEIAALIDKEQFELITQPSSGIVVIQGGAGSGKTTVALHRIAYLNFQDPRRFKPSATLFVVPSQALVRYVSGVLPSLGVSGVPVVTYTGWARTTRMRCLPDSPTSYNAEPPEQVSRVKKHPALLRLLEDHVARQAAHIGAELTAAYAGALAEWDRLARRALVPRLAGIASWLKRADLPPASRVALEGVVKRWKKRADDVVLECGGSGGGTHLGAGPEDVVVDVRHPQDQVREGQVGEQVPFGDQMLQPRHVIGRQGRVFRDHLGHRQHARHPMAEWQAALTAPHEQNDDRRQRWARVDASVARAGGTRRITASVPTPDSPRDDTKAPAPTRCRGLAVPDRRCHHPARPPLPGARLTTST